MRHQGAGRRATLALCQLTALLRTHCPVTAANLPVKRECMGFQRGMATSDGVCPHQTPYRVDLQLSRLVCLMLKALSSRCRIVHHETGV